MIKRKRKHHILLAILLLTLIIGVINVGFTPFGYSMTISLRGFKEVKEDIYIDKNFTGDRSNILSILDESQKRLDEFFGDTGSTPKIIICGDLKKLYKLGWTGSIANNSTNIFFGAHSYIIITPDGINVDVLAHELTHAEIDYRLYKGKLWYKPMVPIWFHEGVALQNDYRKNYDYDAWIKATDNGKNITDFSQLESTSQFYNPDIDIRRYNYIISKEEVSSWLKTREIDDLIQLISDVHMGENFNDLYSIK